MISRNERALKFNRLDLETPRPGKGKRMYFKNIIMKKSPEYLLAGTVVAGLVIATIISLWQPITNLLAVLSKPTVMMIVFIIITIIGHGLYLFSFNAHEWRYEVSYGLWRITPVKHYGNLYQKLRQYFPVNKKQEGRIRLIGLILLRSGLILIGITSFFLFDYWHCLDIYLIVLGGIAIIVVALFLFNYFSDHFMNAATLASAILSLVGFAYYLDFFIFGWNRPWISVFVAAVIIRLIAAFVIYGAVTKKRDQKREQAEALVRTAERNAFILEKQEKLASMNLVGVFAQYIIDKKSGKITSTARLAPYLDRMDVTSATMPQEDRQRLVHLILDSDVHYDETLLRALISRLDRPEDSELMLFINPPRNLEHSPSFFFKYSKKKQEIIKIFLDQAFAGKFLYNSVKKNFYRQDFLGVMHALAYSYCKEEDEVLLQKLVHRMEEIITFAVKCLPELWDDKSALALIESIEQLKNIFSKFGIQVKFPDLSEITEKKK